MFENAICSCCSVSGPPAADPGKLVLQLEGSRRVCHLRRALRLLQRERDLVRLGVLHGEKGAYVSSARHGQHGWFSSCRLAAPNQPSPLFPPSSPPCLSQNLTFLPLCCRPPPPLQVHGDIHALLGGAFDCNVDMQLFHEEHPEFSPGLLSFVLEYLTGKYWPGNSFLPSSNVCDTECLVGQAEPCGCTCSIDAMGISEDEVCACSIKRVSCVDLRCCFVPIFVFWSCRVYAAGALLFRAHSLSRKLMKGTAAFRFLGSTIYCS